MYTYPSFLSGYVQNALGAGSVLVGMIVGSYGFVQMLLRIPLGICSDRVKKRRVFVQAGFLAAILSGAGLSLVALAAARGGISPVPVLFLRGLSGGGAAAWVAFSVLAADQAPPDKTGEAMSRISFFQNMATVAAMPLGSWIMTRFGAAWAFALAAAAGAAGLILISGVEDLPPRGEAMTVREICTLAKNRKLIAGTLLATLFQLVTWATVQGFTQNWALEYVSGFDGGKLGMLAVSYMLPNALVCRISGGYLSKKLGPRGVVCLGFGGVAAACCLYPGARTVAALLGVQALFGAGMGMILPLSMALAVEDVPASGKGAAMGFYQAVYGAGMFLGPVLAGAVIEAFSGKSLLAGYRANFYVSAALAAAGVLLAAALIREKKIGRK